MGIPKDSIIKYETSLKTDKFVLVCHGTAAEMEHAQGILKNTAATEVNVHSGLAGQPA